MRLGTLSRKISLRPAEIVAFLASQGITVEDNANTRVPDEATRLVLSKFAPTLILEEVEKEEAAESAVVASPIANDEPPVPAPEAVQESPVVSETQAENFAESTNEPGAENVSNEASTSQEQSIEVIKAPKVELQGLKVLGKIELPEPKKKENASAPVAGENAVTDEEAKTSNRERQPRKQGGNRGQSSPNRPRKNPIALQREREAKEAEQRKEEALRKEKERRTQHYMQRVKTVAPAKKIKLVDEPLGELKDEAPDEPKTLWGKFVRWLTSH